MLYKTIAFKTQVKMRICKRTPLLNRVKAFCCKQVRDVEKLIYYPPHAVFGLNWGTQTRGRFHKASLR